MGVLEEVIKNGNPDDGNEWSKEQIEIIKIWLMVDMYRDIYSDVYIVENIFYTMM